MGLQSPALEGKLYSTRMSGSRSLQNGLGWPKSTIQKTKPVRSLGRCEGSGRNHPLARSRLWHCRAPACPHGKWSGVVIHTWFGGKLISSGKDSGWLKSRETCGSGFVTQALFYSRHVGDNIQVKLSFSEKH